MRQRVRAPRRSRSQDPHRLCERRLRESRGPDALVARDASGGGASVIDVSFGAEWMIVTVWLLRRRRVCYTRDLEDMVVWLAQQGAKEPIAGILRIAWDSVGRIVARAAADPPRRVATSRPLGAGSPVAVEIWDAAATRDVRRPGGRSTCRKSRCRSVSDRATGGREPGFSRTLHERQQASIGASASLTPRRRSDGLWGGSSGHRGSSLWGVPAGCIDPVSPTLKEDACRSSS